MSEPQKTNDTPDGRSTTFQATQGGGEMRSGGTLLVEAYVVLWVILMAWLFMLWNKQRDLHARIDAVERSLDKAAEKNT